MKHKHDRPAAPASALAVSIDEAARRVGLSRSGFYKHYLTNHRLRAIPTGPQGRIIDVGDLERAYAAYKAEWSADDSAAE